MCYEASFSPAACWVYLNERETHIFCYSVDNILVDEHVEIFKTGEKLIFTKMQALVFHGRGEGLGVWAWVGVS